MNKMKVYKGDILVIGSGAGATGLVSELVKKNYNIIVADSGKKDVEWSKDFVERGKNIYKPNGTFPKSEEGVMYYRHLGIGGTVETSCANAVRFPDDYLSDYGITIDEELDEIEKYIGVTEMPDEFIGHNSNLLMDAAKEVGHSMNRMTKLIDFEKCKKCSFCEFMCFMDARWSTMDKILSYEEDGKITFLDGLFIEKLEIESDRARAAIGSVDGKTVRIEVDKIIVAAGGIGTPIILQNSGIEAGSNLFLDVYVNVYGRSKNFNNERNIPMAGFYRHPDESFIIAPFMDADLWHSLSKMKMSKWFNGEHYSGLMVKIADDSSGVVHANGIVNKEVTENDLERINTGVEIAKKILLQAGVSEETIVVTSPKGAHPGGTASIGKVVDTDFKVKGMDNLYVADASLLPYAPGKPPIVTIMALGKKLGKAL